MRKEKRIALIVLGAGQSRRMGQSKLTLPLGNRPIFAHVLEAATATNLPVYAVIRRPHEELEALCGFFSVMPLYNDNAHLGQATSVVVGVETAGPLYDGLLFLPGDMPFLDTPLLQALVRSFTETNQIVRPYYKGKGRAPVLFGRDWYEDLRALTGDVGGRKIIQYVESHICYVPWEQDCFFDIDTPEAYERAKEIYDECSTHTGRR